MTITTGTITTTVEIQKQKRAALRARRKPLFAWYEKNPNDTRLVLEIKDIDDQIAECTREIEHGVGPRN